MRAQSWTNHKSGGVTKHWNIAVKGQNVLTWLQPFRRSRTKPTFFVQRSNLVAVMPSLDCGYYAQIFLPTVHKLVSRARVIPLTTIVHFARKLMIDHHSLVPRCEAVGTFSSLEEQWMLSTYIIHPNLVRDKSKFPKQVLRDIRCREHKCIFARRIGRLQQHGAATYKNWCRT